MATEDVAEHREDVVHVHAAAEAAEATSSRRVEPELVILPALVRVVQHFISFCSLLKFLLSCLVAGVTVWVVFDGKFAVRDLYLVFRGVAVHAQHLVIVSFLCHNSYPTALLSYSNFRVADHFVVERVTGLYTVDDLAFLLVSHAGNHGHGLMEVSVKVFAIGVNLLHA